MDNVNKSPYSSLLNMTPHEDNSITTHAGKMTISDIIHEQKE